MSDLAIAAAAAGSQQALSMDICNQTPTAAAAQESPRAVHENPYELPSVDDLEVAAAAAAAAMQAMQELHQDEKEASEEESSSSSDEDSNTDSESDHDNDDHDDTGRQQQQQQQQQQQPVTLQLTSTPDGSVRVSLQISQQQQQQQQEDTDVIMATRDPDSGTDSSSSEDESSSSSSSESSSDVESIDYDEMRSFINKAYAAAEEGDDVPLPTLEEDLGLSASVAPLTDIVVPEDIELKQAGSIMSVLEGMVVVQGLANSRALDYGSVLLLGDRSPIGRVEEVFGPVTHPLYALRYAGPQPAPAGLVADERVFFTDSLVSLVQDDVYTVAKTAGKQKKAAAVDYEPEADDDEPYFSDDEAEAEWRRSQGLTKRKHGSGDRSHDNSSSRGRGRGRGRYGGAAAGSSGGGGGGRGGPSVGFKAHATAGQLQGLGIQQDSGRRGGGRGRRGGRSGGNAAESNALQQQQQGGWQNAGAPCMGNGQLQQMYPSGHPGRYGHQQMMPAPGYMQQPMGAGGVYVNPGMMQGLPPHMMHMGVMQQYPPQQQQQQQPGGVPPGYGQPMPYGGYQWTGYGAPPPAQR